MGVAGGRVSSGRTPCGNLGPRVVSEKFQLISPQGFLSGLRSRSFFISVAVRLPCLLSLCHALSLCLSLSLSCFLSVSLSLSLCVFLSLSLSLSLGFRLCMALSLSLSLSFSFPPVRLWVVWAQFCTTCLKGRTGF